MLRSAGYFEETAVANRATHFAFITRAPADKPSGFAVILGTNEIASAVAVYLRRAGWAVALSHDPYPPVIRRRMAFYDALFDDRIVIEGIGANCVERSMDIRAALAVPDEVTVTRLDLSEILVVGRIDVLIDARMQKYRLKPDLRWLAELTIGLGPGFEASKNCDIAVETQPARAGIVLSRGRAAAADRKPELLGNVGKERFVYTKEEGLWHTPLEIGTRVFKDFVLGYLDGVAVRAPFDGFVRGIARDGITVPAGVKLVEIDPRQRRAEWTGIDNRGRTIARASLEAVTTYARQCIASERLVP